jgi:type IV secretion system protein VirD4
MAINKKKVFQKGWLSIVVLCAFLSLFLSYSLFAILFHVMHMKSFEFKFEEFIQTYPKFSEILDFTFGDPNLKQAATVVMIGFFVYLLYLRRQNLFQKHYDDASEFGLHGTNKMEDPEKLMDGEILSKKSSYHPRSIKETLKDLEEGIVIGKIPGKNKLMIIHDKTEIDNKNVLVYGASGAGKGQSYVLPNILNIRTQSLIVVDPKAENYALTHQIKRDQGYKVYNVDFIDFSQSRYNPLDLIENDEEAQKVSRSIVENSTVDGKDDFFSERAQKLLAGLMVYVKATYPNEDANMATLIDEYNRHISDPKKCDKFLNSLPHNHPARGLLLSVLPALVGNTRASVIASFDSAISIFQLSRIKEMTKVSDFSFDEFQEGKSILYVKIPIPENPYQPLTSVFFQQMIDRLYLLAKRNESKKLKVPVNFILDEFPNIGRFRSFEKICSTCRGILIYMHTIIQDVSQLEDQKLYGKERTRTIISNHDTQLVLKVNEKETAKMFAERFGTGTKTHKAKSVTYSEGKRSVNINDQFLERNLLTAGEILTMSRNKAYLLIAGHDVMEIEKAWQYEVFGKLITKNRVYNYHKSRRALGYTTPLFNEDVTRDSGVISFEEYQKKNYQNDSSLRKETAAGSEKEPVLQEADIHKENHDPSLVNAIDSTGIDEDAVQEFKKVSAEIKQEQEEAKSHMSNEEMLDTFESKYESIEMLMNTKESVELLKNELSVSQYSDEEIKEEVGQI